MFRVAFALTFLLGVAPVQANTVHSALAGAEVRGTATFRFLGVPLYEAQLYTQQGKPLDWKSDFGLQLTYLRNVSEQNLVDSTMVELERTGAPLPVRKQLEQCYADVRKGDAYLAISNGDDAIGFWLNGTRVCTLSHPAIKMRFMAIFLGDNTRSKSFTRRLKGE
jgi:hypothetical protein